MTTTYNTRTSLAAYVDALYGPSMQAISRVLTQSNGYLQNLANTASSAADTAQAAATTATNAASQAQSDYNKTNILFLSFGKTWYGDLSSDPTDNPNDGGPLDIGARYWNTTDNKIRIYTSSGWQDFDAQAEHLHQEAALSASQAAQSANNAQSAANTATNAANSVQADVIQIQKDLSELETLFTLPLPPNEIPQVNSGGNGFNFVKPALLGVTAWNSNIANNGGYPQYSVVCDPNIPGLLYESRSNYNTQRPSFNAQYWSFFSPPIAISVEAFGVTNDPGGTNVEANTQAYTRALQQSAGQYKLVHPMTLQVTVNQINITNSNIDWEMNGNITLANNQNTNIVFISGDLVNIRISGVGTFWGNSAHNTDTNTPSSPGMGACINVNSPVAGQDTPYQANNVRVEGVQLTDATYAFFGNNCAGGVVSGCQIWNTTYGAIFRAGSNNCILNNNILGNSQLGCGLNGPCYNSIIKGNLIYSNGNQAMNMWVDDNQDNGPQWCLIENNYVHDNGGGGIIMQTSNPNQHFQTIRIQNNHFQNNAVKQHTNDILVQTCNEISIMNNTFDRCMQDYTTSLNGDCPNSVWVDGVSSQVVIKGNIFKDTGSSTHPGIPLWVQGPSRCAVVNNTFWDTTGVTQQWFGGSITTQGVVEYNTFLGYPKNGTGSITLPGESGGSSNSRSSTPPIYPTPF